VTALDWHAPFEQLREGQRFRSRGRTVTESDVVAFAALTGDWHPQHSDAQWAAGSRFGERIAHGMLLVAFSVGLVPLDPGRVIALRRLHDVVFKRPLALGQTIHVEGAVTRLAQLQDDAGLVGMRWEIQDELGHLVCRAQVEVLWACQEPDRPRAGSGEAAPIEYAAGVFPC